MLPFEYRDQCWQLTHKLAIYKSRITYLESILQTIKVSSLTDSFSQDLAKRALENEQR